MEKSDIEQIEMVITNCFYETYRDILRHSNFDVKPKYKLAVDYLRATKQEIIKELYKFVDGQDFRK